MIELDRNNIRINDKELNLKLPIADTLELEDLVIILLGVHPKNTDMNNVFAINYDCDILWQLNGISYDGSERNSIMYLFEINQDLYVLDDLGNWYHVSLTNGYAQKILRKDLPKRVNK